MRRFKLEFRYLSSFRLVYCTMSVIILNYALIVSFIIVFSWKMHSNGKPPHVISIEYSDIMIILVDFVHRMSQWVLWTRLYRNLWRVHCQGTMSLRHWNLHEWLWAGLPWNAVQNRYFFSTSIKMSKLISKVFHCNEDWRKKTSAGYFW